MNRDSFSIQNKIVVCDPVLTEYLKETYSGDSWVYERMRDSGDTRCLRGRIPVFAGDLDGLKTVVKRHVHGGFLAGLTGDRFISPSRILNSMKAADFLRDNGIRTPGYRFIAWERTGLFIRMESGVAFEHDAIDASDFFFARDTHPDKARTSAIQLGKFVRSLHALHFRHPDMNLMNFLIRAGGKIILVDLDKSKPPVKKLSRRGREWNMKRLIRSIRKQGRARDPEYVRHLIDGVWEGYKTP